MTPAELKTLIESDAEATALANAGNDEACAARCSVIAPLVRVSTMLTERGLYAELGPAMAETILQKLEGYAAASQEYSALVNRFLGWLEPINGGVDFGLQSTLDMAGLLTQCGLLSAEEYAAINSLSLASQKFTAAQIGEAWRS